MTRAIRTLLIISALNFVPVPVAADAIVPGSLAAVEGNTNNGFPFNVFNHSFLSMRYQQVYAASEFGLDPIYIEAMLFRPDSDTGNAFSTSFTSVQVNLSTTPLGPDTLSPTFAANVGPNDTIVRSGALTLSSADVAVPGNTRAFDVLIPFTTPFLYNPSLGNLLLDVRLITDIASTQFDAHNLVGDSVSRVYAGGSTSTTGTTDTLGLVTMFQTSAVNAVPDPASSLSLIMMGIGGLLAARRWTNRI